MKRLALVALLALAATSASAAEHTRVTNPNVLGVELLGRGLAYSVFFDRVLDDELSAGFGYGSVKTKSGAESAVIPAYFTYYFQRQAGSMYATVGAAILTNASAVEEQETKSGGLEIGTQGVIPQLGIGYEHRTDQGFVARLAGYGMIGEKMVPWFGISFGYSF